MILPLILLASQASSSPIGYTAGVTCAAFLVGSRCTNTAGPSTSSFPSTLQPAPNTSKTLLYANPPKAYDWEHKRVVGKKHDFVKDDTSAERMAKLYYRNKAYLDLEMKIDGVPSTMLAEKVQQAEIGWGDWLKELSFDTKAQEKLAKVIKALDDDIEAAMKIPFTADPGRKAASLFDILLGNDNTVFGNESDASIERIKHLARAWEIGF